MFCVVIMSSTKGDGVATNDLLTMRLKLFTPDLACSTLPCSAFVNLVWSALAAYFCYSYSDLRFVANITTGGRVKYVATV